MLAIILRINFLGSNLAPVEVALCAFLLLSKSFLNSLSFSAMRVQTKHFQVVYFVQSFNFISLKFQIDLQSHPFIFFNLLSFWLNITIEKSNVLH